jgi:hypothetical protein
LFTVYWVTEKVGIWLWEGQIYAESEREGRIGKSGSDEMEGKRGVSFWWAVAMAAVGGNGGEDEGWVAAVERWLGLEKTRVGASEG